ncbi:MAG: SPOR domain-containing protein [Arcobacteraceae bacterium]|nr:SPOR domain-containing protein [Arcobacteraceae bacterium]
MNIIFKLLLLFALAGYTYASGAKKEYTIIVCSAKNIENANTFIKNNLANDKKIYILKKSLRYSNRYRVAYGNFKNIKSAKRVKALLSSKLQRLNPYIDQLKIFNKNDLKTIPKGKEYFLVKVIEPKKTLKKTTKVAKPMDIPIIQPKKDLKMVTNTPNTIKNHTVDIEESHMIILKREKNIITKPQIQSKESTKSKSISQNKYFIGANIIIGKAYSNVSGTVSMAGSGVIITGDTPVDTNINFKAGVLTNYDRFTITTGKKLDAEGMKYSSTTLGYDRLFNLYKGYIPYAGVHIGSGKLEDELFGNKNINEYGVQAGILKDINKNFQFEAGIIYTQFSGKITATNRSGTYQGSAFTNLNGSREMKDFAGIYTGLNYKF